MDLKKLKLVAVFTALTISLVAQKQVKFNKVLKKSIDNTITEFGQISEERKKTLIELGNFILEDKQKNNKAILIFVCTSNSRRSHLSQVWMQTAANYYGIDSVFTFSGGTEATEVNSRAVKALKRAGFSINRPANNYNSPYFLNSGDATNTMILYSKKYDNFQNPRTNFIAVMVCSEADKSCPVVPGSNGKIGLPYSDPKEFDNTPEEQKKYDETTKLIARELFFVADYVKTNLNKN